MSQCMVGETPEVKKYHYYSNKSDTTAYTDYDALPRPTFTSTSIQQPVTTTLTPFLEYGDVTRQPFGNTISDHHGSRRSLMNSWKEQARLSATTSFETVINQEPKYHNKRFALISNFAVEN